MKVLSKILFTAAVFLYFSATSFAGLPAFQEFEFFVLAQMVEKVDISTRNGVVKASYLAMIDPVSGKVTTIGNTGHVNCSALDFNSAGDLFATCLRPEPSYEPVLVRLDTVTGVGTEVGPTGITGQISDMAQKDAYNLLVYEEVETPHNVHEINDMTGDSTFIGQPELEGQGNALFLWGDEAVKHVTWIDGANQVYELDKETAQPTFVTNLKVFDNTNGLMAPVVALPCLLFAADGIKGMEAGAILGLNSSDASATTKGAITAFEAAALLQMPIEEEAAIATKGHLLSQIGLAFIDLDGGTAVITTRIEHEYIVDGLAVRQIEPRPIPTLSEWGLITTALILFTCSLFVIVRSKRGFNIG